MGTKLYYTKYRVPFDVSYMEVLQAKFQKMSGIIPESSKVSLQGCKRHSKLNCPKNAPFTAAGQLGPSPVTRVGYFPIPTDTSRGQNTLERTTPRVPTKRRRKRRARKSMRSPPPPPRKGKARGAAINLTGRRRRRRLMQLPNVVVANRQNEFQLPRKAAAAVTVGKAGRRGYRYTVQQRRGTGGEP